AGSNWRRWWRDSVVPAKAGTAGGGGDKASSGERSQVEPGTTEFAISNAGLYSLHSPRGSIPLTHPIEIRDPIECQAEHQLAGDAASLSVPLRPPRRARAGAVEGKLSVAQHLRHGDSPRPENQGL